MDLRFTGAEEGFRREVRAFLDQELPSDWPDAYQDPKERSRFTKTFRKKLVDRGWLTMAWPKEYGGQERSVTEQLVFNQEMALRRAPPAGGMGIQWVGPLLMLYGTEEQKREHIPRVVQDEVQWCTLYSEPEAGSDLASLRTQATQEGDFFVVNGEKVWTSGGHESQWGLLAARTDPDAPKHRGVSMLLMPMQSPGVTVKPLYDMTGDHHFNQVFFEEVRLPRSSLLGELNRGWYQMTVGLQFERSSASQVMAGQRVLDDLVGYAREARLGGNPIVRQKLADLAIRSRVARMLSYRVVWLQEKGAKNPPYEASVDKLFNSELNQQMSRVGIELLGLHGQLGKGERRAPLKSEVEYAYRQRVSSTIAAGTSEVQRNIIAERGLGLPRG